MRFSSMAGLAFCWLTIGTGAMAEDAPHADFTRVLLGPKNDVVGVLKSEGGEYRVFDLRTRQDRMIPQDKALKVDRNLTDEQTINYVGLPAVLAYRIKERSSVANQKGQTTGKVAQVSPTATYVTLGTKNGVHVGQKVGVFRPGVEIKDPDTGPARVRAERPKIAELEIFEVSDAFSKGRLVGGLEVALKPGDEVEGTVARFMVAVLPITDEADVNTVSGSTLREQLVTALVQMSVPVVERSQLDKVLGEEILQNHRGFFDASQAQQFGKQLGASVVVTGKVAAAGNAVEAHVRLVNVGTGEIQLAVSGKLADDAPTPSGSGKVVASTQVQELMKKARLGDTTERRAAIRELGESKSPAAAKFLAEEMLTKDPFTTGDVLVSMGPLAADALARAIDIGDFHERIQAMRIFTKVATKKHIPFLKKLLSDFHLKRDAERTIRRIQDE